jgi:hypothetical protein
MSEKMISGWWLSPTPLKNMNQIGSSSQLWGKIKNVPNQQPDIGVLNHPILGGIPHVQSDVKL